MNSKIFIIAILALICTSCGWNWGWNWDVEKETQATTKVQRILGPTDCVNNEWSWNNGIATVGDSYNHRYKYFSFITNTSGEFTFDCKGNSSYATLSVTLGGQTAFEDNNLESVWITINLGYLKSGTSVRFEGEDCSVKDLIISDK